MNRLFHLRETLPVNIDENSTFGDIEFILLDYNSSDGLGNWIKAKMMKYIEVGILKYYRTEDPLFFSITHSKNLASRLATGDIICMIDADNYAGLGYFKWVNAIFASEGKNAIITTIERNSIPYRDQGGKLAFHRNLFASVNGYDESLTDYGFDDVDLVCRLESKGGARVLINDRQFLRYIGHTDMERYCKYGLINNLACLYIQKPIHHSNRLQILYLFQDQTFIKGSFNHEEALRNNIFKSWNGWTIDKNAFAKGLYELSEATIILKHDDNKEIFSKLNNERIYLCQDPLKLIWEKAHAGCPSYLNAIMLFNECYNRLKFQEKCKQDYFVNPKGMGIGTVRLNFNKNPIQITSHDASFI
jgi:hypothetical protein